MNLYCLLNTAYQVISFYNIRNYESYIDQPCVIVFEPLASMAPVLRTYLDNLKKYQQRKL